jgi:riboflavin kinase/FMN adenylyltransferase
VHLGPSPTFGVKIPRVEAHLIGFEGNLYGELLTLDFVARLREPARFASPDLLVQQLNRDIAMAKATMEPLP